MMIDYTKTKISTAATVEPVSITELKDHLRIDRNLDEEDWLLEDYIKSAREYAEGYTGRRFITQKWKYYISEFPSKKEIDIPYPPLQASSFAFTYTSASGSSNSVCGRCCKYGFLPYGD